MHLAARETVSVARGARRSPAPADRPGRTATVPIDAGDHETVKPRPAPPAAAPEPGPAAGRRRLRHLLGRARRRTCRSPRSSGSPARSRARRARRRRAAGLAGWLLGHGVPLGTSTGPLGLAPLLLTLLAAWRLNRAGLHVTRAIGARAQRLAAAGALQVAGTIGIAYGLLGALAALIVDGRGTEVSAGRAALDSSSPALPSP